MKRFAWIVCAFSLLALNACGDEDAPACDDERYDCTPLDDGKQPPGDGQNPPDDSTLPNPPQWEEGWVPSKEDLAAIGVVFPEDLDPKPPSTTERSFYSDDHPCRDETQTEQTAYNLFNCDLGWKFFGQSEEEYVAPNDLRDHEYYCEIMDRGRHSAPVMHLYDRHEHSRDYDTLYAPPTDSFDWACIETPYGAAWLPLDDFEDAQSNVARWTLGLYKPRILPTTCHQTTSWIAFMGDGRVGPDTRGHDVLYAYTVGTELDAFKPVTTCQPWGPNDQSSD